MSDSLILITLRNKKDLFGLTRKFIHRPVEEELLTNSLTTLTGFFYLIENK